MDQTALAPPVLTGLDAATQAIAGMVYLTVGIVAWASAPRDIRTRVFLAFAVVNAVVFGVPVGAWLLGVKDATQFPRAAMAAVFAALGTGALLLFHFTQVFPARRPWLQASGVQLPVAYVLTPLAIAGLVFYAPTLIADVTPPYLAAFLVFGFPLLVLLGFVLPVSAIVSLLRSHRDAVAAGRPVAKPILWILVSQIAGGVLAIVFAPVVTSTAPGTVLVSAITLLIWLLGLLTPIAFAASIWLFGLLSTDA